MAAAALELVMTLKDEATAKLKEVENGLGGVNKTALAIGAAGAVAVGALAKGLWDCAQAAADEEIGMTKLATAVNATGISWDTVSAEVESYIAAAQRRTAFDDSVQRQSLTNLITTTGSYEQALSLLPLAMDLARAKGMDLVSASDLVGKVAMGNTGILSRYGIVLQDGATAQEALAAMQERFAGQADAYGKTNAAAAELMGQQWDNLKETIGAYVIPILTQLFQWLASLAEEAIPWVDKTLSDLQPVFETVWSAIQTAVSMAMAVIDPLLQALSSWFSGPGTSEPTKWQSIIGGIWSSIQALIEAVVPVILGLISTAWAGISAFTAAHWDTIKGIIETAWGLIETVVMTYLGVIKGMIDAWAAIFRGDWQGFWSAVKGIITTIWDGIKAYIAGVLDIIKAAARLAWDAIKSDVQSAWDGIVGAVRAKVDDVRVAMGSTWNTIHERTVSAWNTIKNDITAPIRDALGVIQSIVDQIISAWQRLGSFHIPLPHFRAGTRMASVAGIEFPVPDIGIDWYGRGLPPTVFTQPTLIGVGERGPERVTVTPIAQAASPSSGSISLTFVYSPQVSLASQREAQEVIAPILAEVLRREARRVSWQTS